MVPSAQLLDDARGPLLAIQRTETPRIWWSCSCASTLADPSSLFRGLKRWLVEVFICEVEGPRGPFLVIQRTETDQGRPPQTRTSAPRGPLLVIQRTETLRGCTRRRCLPTARGPLLAIQRTETHHHLIFRVDVPFVLADPSSLFRGLKQDRRDAPCGRVVDLADPSSLFRGLKLHVCEVWIGIVRFLADPSSLFRGLKHDHHVLCSGVVRSRTLPRYSED